MDSKFWSTTFPPDSEISSVYSDDDLISEAHSTGTQIHHRTHLQPTIGGMAREDGQNFKRLSTSSLPQEDPRQDLDGLHAPVLHTSNNPTASYHFESPEEAQVRYQKEIAQRCIDAIALLPSADLNIPSRRQSISFRRHERVASMGSYSFRGVRDTVLSTGSAPSPFLSDAGELAQEYIQETRIVRDMLQSSDHVFEPIEELAELPTPQPRKSVVSCDPSEPDLVEASTAALRRRTHRNAALQALSGRVPDTVDSGRPTDSSHPRNRAPAQTLNVPQRQGRVDWRDASTNGPLVRSGLYSATGREYGLGDHTRGYMSGGFVTSLQELTLLPKERKKNLLKRLFCSQ